ncbi:MAG: type II toxin-antitoxin system VapC family toxin [Rhodocyclaceae bacterium]|nr:type II toxin-antitoxin system VapC family toxin [Rhodocyclaceae bacterium]
MAVYVDTSVLVALCTREGKSAGVSRWYAACTDDLVSAMWCVAEFASVLSIKQRTGQIDAAEAQTAWRQFERLCANDLQLLPMEPATFHRAAVLTLDAASGLRAGDALHLAAALGAKAKSMATLDDVLAKNAKRMKLKLVAF